MRLILHVDMDAFYAAIEQRDRPELRGRPVIVGGPTHRGVVSTASYEARRFGVHSAMPMARAVKLCPQGIVVPVRMDVYAGVSRQIMAVLHRFSPLVEPLSLDEAFLDATGTQRLYGEPLQLARRIKDEIRAVTQLTCSVGIAANKFLAKLASDLNKPDGVTLVPFGQEAEFIAPLPVKRLWGVGPKTDRALQKLGLRTIGQLAAADPDWLRRALGPHQAEHLQALAQARDDREVVPEREAKSVGAEETLGEDVRGKPGVLPVLRRQCDRVAERLRADKLQAGGVRVKVRFSQGFRLMTRETRLAAPCDDAHSLVQAALPLLDKLQLDQPIRLVGVAATHLIEPGEPLQQPLFGGSQDNRHSRLEHTLDDIRARFGDVIRRAKD